MQVRNSRTEPAAKNLELADLETDPGEITQLLNRMEDGDSRVLSELAVLVYEQLYRIARQASSTGSMDLSLGPTVLVNEAFLHLMRNRTFEKSPNRRYFFAAAARAMRQIIVDHARQRGAQKRGGQAQRLPLDQMLNHYFADQKVDLLELDESLTKLEAVDGRKAKVVELKFFAGLKMSEIAEQLDVSQRTVETDWRTARAFLRAQLACDEVDPSMVSDL